MAAVDYFLKIDTIDGESTKKGFEKQIEIETFEWEAKQEGKHRVGSGGGGGKVLMGDFQFTTKTNTATPKLMLACATGQAIKSAVLTCRKAGGKQEEYLTWKFSDILLSSFKHESGQEDDSLPRDTFGIAFTKIEIAYKPQKADGSLGAAVTTGYNLGLMDKV